jgi:uncharacterized protein YndB with AHSA1/START domain
MNDNITIATIIHAPVSIVWKAWTDPIVILKWFGSDPNGKGVRAEMDVRPGGSYEITFKNSDNAEHTCSGIYKEVYENQKLSFSWTWKSEPGIESVVTVILSPEINASKMLFEHANLGTASAHNYLSGWAATFEKLKQLLTAKSI